MAKVETTIPVGGVAQPGVQDIMALRSMTQRFGMLHEVQVINLRVWPGIFLGEAARVQEIRYQHEGRELELDLGDIATGLNLTEGFERLDKAVKFLLGVDVTLKVIVRGRAIYSGEPKDEKWLSQTSTPRKPPSSRPGKKTEKSRRSRRR